MLELVYKISFYLNIAFMTALVLQGKFDRVNLFRNLDLLGCGN
jgi:hypothetical protein